MCTSKCTCILKFQGSSSILLLLHLKNPHHLHLLRHALLKWRWMEAEVMGFGMPASSVQSLNHIFIFWRGLTRNLKIVFTALHTCQSCLFAAPRTIARQAPLSMGFSRQEDWSGLPFPPPGVLPNSEIEPKSPVSPALVGRISTTAPPGKPVTALLRYNWCTINFV